MSQPVEIPVDDPLKSAWFDCSDWGNAQRVVIVAAGKLKWIEDAECWAFYDGKRWSVERGAMEAQRIAHRVIEHVDREAMALGEIAEAPIELKKRVGDWCTIEMAQDRVKVLRGHSVKSGSAGMTAGMLKQARSLITARLTDFDTDPLAYNCQNGTLRFVQGKDEKWGVKFAPHEPGDMIMQLANVLYDAAAEAPFWVARMDMLMPDKQQLAAMQPLYGYTLTGLTSDQAFYVHQGQGGDGKSVTNMALAALHGDYYRHSGIKTWVQGRDGGGSEHRSDLVRLRGDVRFVTSDEPKPSAVFDGEILKQFTGGFVTARGANERTEVTFPPRGKLFIECNKIPRAPSDDKGFRRRFKVYQWLVSLKATPEGAMPIDLVLRKLADESSGILNWLIDGCLQWLTTREIPQPAAMDEVLADYWAESSPLQEWMTEWCDTSRPEAKELSKALYDHFKHWCEDAGIEHIPTSTKFGRDLRDKHFKSWKDSSGGRWRLGISLRAAGVYAGPQGDQDAPAASQGQSAASLPPIGSKGAGPAVDYGSDDDLAPEFD